MKHRLLISILITISNGCAPSVPSDDPVLTSTLSSTTTTNAVSTSTTSNNLNATSTATPTVNTTATVSTTTTIPTTTTTPRPTCCGYPVENIGINTANPDRGSWDNCSQPVSLKCQITNNGVGLDEVSVVGNLSQLTPSQYSLNNLAANPIQVTVVVLCNSTSQLWYSGNSTNSGLLQYQYFTCLYKYANGTYVASGANGTFVATG